MDPEDEKTGKKPRIGFAGLAEMVSDVAIEELTDAGEPECASSGRSDAAAEDRQDTRSASQGRRSYWFSGLYLMLGILAALSVVLFALQPDDPLRRLASREPAGAPKADTMANPGTPFDEGILPFAPEVNTRAPAIEPALPLPANGEIRAFTASEAIAPFQIKSRGTSHFVVKLADAVTDRLVMTIFVRGGQTVQVDVPLGTYEVKYASGERWYGYDKLFGSETSFSRADKIFTFELHGQQISGYSITLYTVASGNLRTRSISAAEF